MSARITVIGENRRIKRTLALTLVMKQVYDWHVYMSSVKRRPVSQQLPIKSRTAIPGFRRHCYEHHVEPRVERLPSLDKLVSEWACKEMYWQ